MKMKKVFKFKKGKLYQVDDLIYVENEIQKLFGENCDEEGKIQNLGEWMICDYDFEVIIKRVVAKENIKK